MEVKTICSPVETRAREVSGSLPAGWLHLRAEQRGELADGPQEDLAKQGSGELTDETSIQEYDTLHLSAKVPLGYRSCNHRKSFLGSGPKGLRAWGLRLRFWGAAQKMLGLARVSLMVLWYRLLTCGTNSRLLVLKSAMLS